MSEKELTPGSEKGLTLTLSKPIHHGEEEITVLTLREATGADLDDFPVGQTTVGAYRRVASRLTGVPGNVLRQMTGADAIALTGLVDIAISPGPAPGGSSS